DDFVVLCKTRVHAEAAISAAEKALSDLRLQLNPRKTRVTDFDSGFTFLGAHFKGTDYSFIVDGKRVVVDELLPDWADLVPAGYRRG
ncbi:MAG: hypothetical protein Q8R28_20260, partial [Dehalococcoidia bacterium]|nr:hypothetical protein [Dehalococcoidia bacterium]